MFRIFAISQRPQVFLILVDDHAHWPVPVFGVDAADESRELGIAIDRRRPLDLHALAFQSIPFVAQIVIASAGGDVHVFLVVIVFCFVVDIVTSAKDHRVDPDLAPAHVLGQFDHGFPLVLAVQDLPECLRSRPNTPHWRGKSCKVPRSGYRPRSGTLSSAGRCCPSVSVVVIEALETVSPAIEGGVVGTPIFVVDAFLF